MTIEIQYMILAQCTICSRIWSGTAYIKSGHLLPLTADGVPNRASQQTTLEHCCPLTAKGVLANVSRFAG
jgi:hypothetical protein